ncbi:MAG: flagellar biosynthesis protein FlhB [Alphaproteobacteria bacterium]|nr:flagellar biosynthesis protein FlhB [Alphaproteobacteria bacterium]
MAEDQDESQKTEEPTPRRLEKSKEDGKSPHSKDLSHFVMLFAVGLLIAFYFPFLAQKLQNILRLFIESSHELYLSSLSSIILEIAFWVATPLVTLLIIALALGFYENKFHFSMKSIVPKLEKISLFKGIKRIFSLKNFVDFIKSLTYVIVLMSVVSMIVYDAVLKSESFIWYSLIDLVHFFYENIITLFIITICIVVVVAILDVFYQRYEYLKSLRMTKQEVKDEHKESEGDPLIKSKIRRIRMERIRNRMMANVPKADVIITNPTHYAIALKYEHTKMNAPVVVAKGQGYVAAKIRELAEEHHIPLVENPPLARALYTIELDQEIPLEHYKVVADIIVYVMKLKNKLPKM